MNRLHNKRLCHWEEHLVVMTRCVPALAAGIQVREVGKEWGKRETVICLNGTDETLSVADLTISLLCPWRQPASTFGGHVRSCGRGVQALENNNNKNWGQKRHDFTKIACKTGYRMRKCGAVSTPLILFLRRDRYIFLSATGLIPAYSVPEPPLPLYHPDITVLSVDWA